MEWYWWVLIVVGLVGLAIIKVKVGGAWLRRQQEKKAQRDKLTDSDDA